MEIPNEITQKLSDAILIHFDGLYRESLYPKLQIEPEPYLLHLANEVFDELSNLIEVTEETLTPIAKRRQVTKRRWLNKELEDNKKSGFHAEINQVAKHLFENYPLEKFRAVYEVESLDELKMKMLNELTTWMRDDDALMCNFPYIKSKPTKSILSALKNDIQYLIVKTVKEESPRGEQSPVISVPNSITNFPYDHTNRIKINANELVEDNFFQNVYLIDDKTKFESRIKVEALEEGLMRENLKMLNSRDQEILIYLMSLKHEALYQPVPMVVEIGDIVRAVYHNDSKKSYMAVKESLIKMDFMEMRIIDEKTLRSTKTEIFYNVTIEADEVTGKEVARIIFSENLIHEFVKNQTVSIYKKIIDRFELKSSKVLIYALQRQRILLATQTEDSNPILFQTNLNFFRGALVFGTKRRTNQIRIIEETLDEIVESEITLKSYSRKGDIFQLEFYPFSDKERIDLLNKNQNASQFLTHKPK